MNYDSYRQRLLESLMAGAMSDADYEKRIAELDRCEQLAAQSQPANLEYRETSDTSPVVAGPNFQLDQYILCETSGSGGMGIVWKAINTKASDLGDVMVAIKVLPKELQRQPGEIDRFQKTFDRARELRHDHICPLHGLHFFDHADIGWYQVMPFLTGCTLAEYREAYVAQHGRCCGREVARLLEPISRALDYAHGEAVAHRDLKPENIFIESEGLHVEHVWLIDFGIAAEIRSTLSRLKMDADSSPGSPAYLSPELLRAGWPDAKSDQYALGVVVYEMLAGHPPFNAADFAVFRHAALFDDVPHLSHESAAVNAVMQRVLAKDKDHRFESCVAFIEALAAAQTLHRDPLASDCFEAAPMPEPVAAPTSQSSASPVATRTQAALLAAPFSRAHILEARRHWAEHLRRPETISLGGSRCLLIPPGVFTMGSTISADALVKQFEAKGYGKANAYDFQCELPAHRITLTRPFWMGEDLVTVGEFKAFISATGYQTDAEKRGGGRAYDVAARQWLKKADCSWSRPGFSQTERHPVVVVSHNDAVAYCAWLSQQCGHRCRLPWEAEWEYAARAGTTGFYLHGNDPEGLPRYANTADTALKRQMTKWPWATIRGNDGYDFTSPVGRFEPNAFGLRDVLGNCWEWCGDRFDADEHYYAHSPVENPQGPAAGSSRVLRGGAWNCEPQEARCSYRLHNHPAFGSNNVGFRMVVEL